MNVYHRAGRLLGQCTWASKARERILLRGKDQNLERRAKRKNLPVVGSKYNNCQEDISFNFEGRVELWLCVTREKGVPQACSRVALLVWGPKAWQLSLPLAVTRLWDILLSSHILQVKTPDYDHLLMLDAFLFQPWPKPLLLSAS
jgi:hypothetical protein